MLRTESREKNTSRNCKTAPCEEQKSTIGKASDETESQLSGLSKKEGLSSGMGKGVRPGGEGAS